MCAARHILVAISCQKAHLHSKIHVSACSHSNKLNHFRSYFSESSKFVQPPSLVIHICLLCFYLLRADADSLSLSALLLLLIQKNKREEGARSINGLKKCSDKKWQEKGNRQVTFWRAHASRPTLYRGLRC